MRTVVLHDEILFDETTQNLPGYALDTNDIETVMSYGQTPDGMAMSAPDMPMDWAVVMGLVLISIALLVGMGFYGRKHII